MLFLLEYYIFILWMPFLQCKGDNFGLSIFLDAIDHFGTDQAQSAPSTQDDIVASIGENLDNAISLGPDLKSAARQIYRVFGQQFLQLQNWAESARQRLRLQNCAEILEKTPYFMLAMSRCVLELLAKNGVLDFFQDQEHNITTTALEQAVREKFAGYCDIGQVLAGQLYDRLENILLLNAPLSSLTVSGKLVAITAYSEALEQVMESNENDVGRCWEGELPTLHSLYGAEVKAMHRIPDYCNVEALEVVANTADNARISDDERGLLVATYQRYCIGLQTLVWNDHLTDVTRGEYQEYFGRLELVCPPGGSFDPKRQLIAQAIMRELDMDPWTNTVNHYMRVGYTSWLPPT